MSKCAHSRRRGNLIIEDMSQNCRYNHGNGIYVPTHQGGIMEDGNVFAKRRSSFVNELETCKDARLFGNTVTRGDTMRVTVNLGCTGMTGINYGSISNKQ